MAESPPRRRGGTSAAATARATASVALALLASSCTGIFRRELPEQAATFAVVDAAAELRVGAARADITPRRSCYLAGFSMDRRSTGVHLPLEVRALVLELGDTRVALVGLDSLGLMRDDVDWIKAGIPEVRADCVFLCSSHTHAAPDPVGIWGRYLLTSGRDRAYLARLAAGVRRAVARAVRRLAPARLWVGEARLPPRGLVRNSNRPGLFDPRLTVVQARTAKGGEPIATLVHLGCHPEVLRRDNTLVSSDFVGAWCAQLRQEGQGEAIFLNGALGAMVTPEPRGVAGVERMAGALAERAAAALARARPIETGFLEVRRADLYMPLTSPYLALGRLAMVIPRESYEGNLRTTVGYLRLGDLEMAFVPGEIEPALAARIRARARRPALLIVGLADDEIGYLMREVDARDPLFAYERSMSPVVDAGERVQRALLGPAQPSASRSQSNAGQ